MNSWVLRPWQNDAVHLVLFLVFLPHTTAFAWFYAAPATFILAWLLMLSHLQQRVRQQQRVPKPARATGAPTREK